MADGPTQAPREVFYTIVETLFTWSKTHQSKPYAAKATAVLSNVGLKIKCSSSPKNKTVANVEVDGRET